MSDLLTARNLYEQGRSAMAHEHFQIAIDLFQRSLEYCPHHKTYELLGECHLHGGNTEACIMPLATAAFLNKGVRAVALLAKAFLNLKHWELAKFAALNAIDREPNNKIANGVLVELQKTGNL